MLDEAAPEVEREQWWEADEASNEVTLEGVNGPFGWVRPVIVGRDELKVNAFFRQESFEDGGAFVVAYLEFGSKSAGFQVVV